MNNFTKTHLITQLFYVNILNINIKQIIPNFKHPLIFLKTKGGLHEMRLRKLRKRFHFVSYFFIHTT